LHHGRACPDLPLFTVDHESHRRERKSAPAALQAGSRMGALTAG
jgi:hypothetical protein